MKTYFSNEQWAQTYGLYLRNIVFVQEMGVSPSVEFDHLDNYDHPYLLMMDNGLPVGAVRYLQKDSETVHPDSLCVLEEYRNRSIGFRLMLMIERKALENGCVFSVIRSHTRTIPFYHQLGYSVASEEYIEDGNLYVEMQKSLIPSLV